jgi:hypothetical protein
MATAYNSSENLVPSLRVCDSTRGLMWRWSRPGKVVIVLCCASTMSSLSCAHHHWSMKSSLCSCPVCKVSPRLCPAQVLARCTVGERHSPFLNDKTHCNLPGSLPLCHPPVLWAATDPYSFFRVYYFWYELGAFVPSGWLRI